MNYKDIAKSFHIQIHNDQLFIDAFTHSSFSNEIKNGCANYERIEFVGDGVLDLIIADLIYNLYPHMPQGEMTKLRANIVCSASLANHAQKYGFSTAIRMGHGMQLSGGANQKILEDVFESFVGAVYLDQGFEVTKKLIESIFMEDLKNYQKEDLTDYKSKLQEYLQANQRGNIHYKVVEESGEPHDKHYVVDVLITLDGIHEIKLGSGEGKSKKTAEENAAKDALSKGVQK